MWVGKQREELNIRLEGNDVKQVKNCMYLGENISENGRVGGGGATQNTSRSECMEKRRWGNDGQKYFKKTEGGGPGFLRDAS